MGGKSKVLHLFKDYFPDFKKINGYIEPFIGGGSVFFYLKENGYLEGKPVYLSDINAELINTHIVVRDKLGELIPLLEKHQKLSNEKYYDNIRKEFPPGTGWTDVEKAAAFIYLVNNSMGGMWRVNSQGKNNRSMSPAACANAYVGEDYQSKNNLVKDELFKCSKLLQGTIIRCHPFEKILDILELKDVKNYLIFFDPPYFSVGYQQYSKDGFNVNSRLNIPKVFKELDKRGNKVMMSNSDSPTIYTYFKGYHINQIQTERRQVALDGVTKENMKNAKKWTEVVVTNYKPPVRQLDIMNAWD